MSDFKLIMESWRDFFGIGSPDDYNPKMDPDHNGADLSMFEEEHDEFYYLLGGDTHPRMMEVDDLANKIAMSNYAFESCKVRPAIFSRQGKFYSWKKFKYLKQGVEAVKQGTQSSPPAQFSLGAGGEIINTNAKEPEKSRSIDTKKIKSELALAVVSSRSLEMLVLYHAPTIQADGLPVIIGMIALGGFMDKHGPCIPKTLQVRFSAVDKKFQKTGFGTILYKLAAAHAKVTVDGGITSDHYGSTSPAAERRWDSITSDPEFYKRKTKAGNDEFDYGGRMTPDPDDDCEDISDSGAFMPHSFGVTNKAIETYKDLIAVDKNGAAYGDSDDSSLYRKAMQLFSRNYGSY